MNKIVGLFLLGWVAGNFHHDCTAADFKDKEPEGHSAPTHDMDDKPCTGIRNFFNFKTFDETDERVFKAVDSKDKKVDSKDKEPERHPAPLPYSENNLTEWVRGGFQGSVNWLTSWFKGAENATSTEETKRLAEEEKERLAEAKISFILSRLAIGKAPPEMKGYEATCEKFLRGVVIFKPRYDSDDGMLVLRICDLPNPLGIGKSDNPLRISGLPNPLEIGESDNLLDSAFDLSSCSWVDKSIMLATGYRKEPKRTELIKKTQIWITPLFLLDLRDDTQDYLATYSVFSSKLWGSTGESPEVGIFLNWGEWGCTNWHAHMWSEKMEDMGSSNFFEKWSKSRQSFQGWGDTGFLSWLRCFTLKF